MGKLFHTLVVFSAGLCLASCGRSEHDDGTDDDDGGSSGTGGTSAGGSAGDGQGGTLILGQAGTGHAGAEPAPGGATGTGGGSDGGLSLEPSNVACGTVGWDCTSGANGFTMDDCVAVATRPTSQDDCATGERLTCREGRLPSGEWLAFDCECVSGGERCGCPDEEGDVCHGSVVANECSSEGVLCGCAITCITK
jgi:hypothetical protein